MLINVNATNTAVNVTEDTRGADTAATVAVTTTASVALAANAVRARYSIYNTGSATVFIRENATVTNTLYTTPIPPGFMWKEDFTGGSRYLGVVSIIGAAATSVLVSESSIV